jgi:hypothetical protein
MKKPNNSAEAQRSRLLKKLQEKPCTTMEARHGLDILGVAPRIHELRHKHGYNIKTHWTIALNPGGRNHRVAQYVLFPGKYKETI